VSFFDTAYEGSPPWDLGRPQRAVVELAEAGRIVGSVLDVGCGTGEHALYLAERGHAVVGVDLSPRAIELAEAKARERGSPAVFEVWDALRVDELGRPFDTALDVGMFHTLTDEERPIYARSLWRVDGPVDRARLVRESTAGVDPRVADDRPAGRAPHTLTATNSWSCEADERDRAIPLEWWR